MNTQTASQTSQTSQTYQNSYSVLSSVDTILSMVETRSHNDAIVDSILSHVTLPMVDYILCKVNH